MLGVRRVLDDAFVRGWQRMSVIVVPLRFDGVDAAGPALLVLVFLDCVCWGRASRGMSPICGTSSMAVVRLFLVCVAGGAGDMRAAPGNVARLVAVDKVDMSPNLLHFRTCYIY